MGQHQPLDPRKNALGPRVRQAINQAVKMVTEPLFGSDRFSEMDRTELLGEVRKLTHEADEKQDSSSKVVAELQTHQEELQAQSQGLLEARHDLELSRDRYLELYDSAPFGYVTLDQFGIIKEINLTGTLLLEQERPVCSGIL